MTTKIRDDQTLIGVKSEYGNDKRIWDDGFGPLWVYRESLGVVGVVRAKAWEDAYDCVLDEIMSDADVDDEDNRTNKDGNLPEGLHWRGNGEPSNSALTSPLASEDLNGSSLELLTEELNKDLGLIITVEDDN